MLLAQNTNLQVVNVTESTLGYSVGQKAVAVIYVLICVSLMIAIVTRTTKSEGLSGSMMGPSESSFRGKKSADDTIDTVTNVLAMSFLVLSLVMSYAFR